jgi:hypothetical protein
MKNLLHGTAETAKAKKTQINNKAFSCMNGAMCNSKSSLLSLLYIREQDYVINEAAMEFVCHVF